MCQTGVYWVHINLQVFQQHGTVLNWVLNLLESFLANRRETDLKYIPYTLCNMNVCTKRKYNADFIQICSRYPTSPPFVVSWFIVISSMVSGFWPKHLWPVLSFWANFYFSTFILSLNLFSPKKEHIIEF